MEGVQKHLSQTDVSETAIFVAKINTYTSAIVSLIGNVLVLCLANVKRHHLKFSTSSITIVYVSMPAMVYSVNCVLSCPIIHVHQNELLIINNGILKNALLGRMSLCIFALFILYSALNSATSVFVKYMLVCRNHLMYNNELYVMHSILCLVAVLWTLTFAYAMWFQHTVFHDNHEHPLKGRPELFSEMDNRSLTLSLSLLLVLLVCAIVFMLFCSQRIKRKLNAIQDDRHKKLQKRMCRLLLVQTALPFILLHLPVILCCTVLQPDYTTHIILDGLSLLYPWYPACIPFVVLWNSKPILSSLFATNKPRTMHEPTVKLW